MSVDMDQVERVEEGDNEDEASDCGSPEGSFRTARTTLSQSPEKLPEAAISSGIEHTSALIADSALAPPPGDDGSNHGDPSKDTDDASQDPEAAPPPKVETTDAPVGLVGWNYKRRKLLRGTVEQLQYSYVDHYDSSHPNYVALATLIKGSNQCNPMEIATAVYAFKGLFPEAARSRQGYFELFNGKAFESLSNALRERRLAGTFNPSDIAVGMYKALITAYCVAFKDKGPGWDYLDGEKRDEALEDALTVATWMIRQPGLVHAKLRNNS